MQEIDEYDFLLIRGDVFHLDMGLTLSFVDVFENPEAYVAKLVLRDDQDDTLTPRLTLTATPEVESIDPGVSSPPAAVVMFRFTASAAETQALPQWNLVGYAELRTAVGDTVIERLFNSRVTVGD